jgi:dipeptidyl aminopeptidase/acylaminoacyl peptidase
VWLDAAARARQEKLGRTFRGLTVNTLSESSDHQRVIVEVGSRSSAPVCYFVDLNANRADIIDEEYPGLIDRKLGEVRYISYKARDGLEIPAYLTLPAGVSDPKNLPMVVLPHGGPASRDEDGFDWISQYLSALGYLVLQPEFRGSSGYGTAFMEAGYHQWGGLMQDDVTDGVRAMAQQGLADPKRVCIVGASYGGFAALEGASFTPDLYACAVSINGVSDLPDLLTYDAGIGENANELAAQREHIGSALDPLIAAKSPARAAEAITVPVLLIHSTNDTVVPFAQSKKMAEILQRHGKSVKLVELPGDDHWLSAAATRTQMLRALGEFLQQHLPP